MARWSPEIKSYQWWTENDKDLLDIVDECYLKQHIDKPTHRSWNVLDLIFSKNYQLIHSFQYVETVFSDHYVVECNAVYKQGTDSKSGVNIPTNTGIGPDFDLLNFFSHTWPNAQ